MKLSYLKMVELGDKIGPNTGQFPVLRVALLSDSSTQQLTKILKACLWQRGFYPEIYEAEFDTMATEVLNIDSGLFAFQPNYVWFNLSSQNYRGRYYHTSAEDKDRLPAEYVNELRSLFLPLNNFGCQTIVNLLPLPQERLFGNYSARTLNSLHGSILEVNRLLAQHAGEKPLYALNDVAYVAATVGLENWYDERLWTHSKYPCSPKYFPALAGSAADVIQTMQGKIVKCIVLDLDNTLWGGVIGDDGINGIELGDMGLGEAYERFQRYLLNLKQRGLVLAVCSKNDDAVARGPFREHPNMVLREKDIAVFVANWNAKSANIEYIAKVLNLGLDSLVFVDDSAFERNEVRHALPDLRVPEMPEDPANYASFLESEGLFETTTFSDDDKRRAEMYGEEAQRSTLELKSATIDEYLQSLQMVMTCRPIDALHLPRAAQLIQRSNQFNLRTQRISETQCREFMENPGLYPCFYLKLRDRFGDYGLICVVCTRVKDDKLEIIEYVMSCRVLNRGVEQYTMTHLANVCRAKGLKAIRGEYIPTKKNKMVSKYYEQFGFKLMAETPDKSTWELEPTTLAPQKFFIQDAPDESQTL